MGFGLSSFGGLTDAIGGFMGSSTGTAVTSAFVNNYFNKKAASRQFAYTKSLIDYENEYNKPVNQMKRLEEAGLNPNLVYNNGSATMASATGSAPQVKPAQLDLLSAYNLEAQNKLLTAQAKEVDARTGLIKTQNQNWEHDHETMTKLFLDLGKRVLDKLGSKGLSDYNSNSGNPVWTRYKGRPTKLNFDRFGRPDLGA